MDIKQIIAQNLSRLIDQSPVLDTVEKVSSRSGVGFGTVRRARKAQGNITVVNLDGVARAFGVDVAYLVTNHGEALKSQNTKPSENHAVNQMQSSYENKVAGTIKPKSKRDKLSDRINQALERINEDGLLVAIGRIETLTEEYPRVVKQTPSS